MYEIIKCVNPDETGMMNAKELFEALIELGLTNDHEYQTEIAPEIERALELHPIATIDEIAEAYIDDILELEDALGDLEIEVLVVEDYVGTDRGYWDCSYVLGYRIQGGYTCKCGKHFVRTENHNYCGYCGAKL